VDPGTGRCQAGEPLVHGTEGMVEGHHRSSVGRADSGIGPSFRPASTSATSSA
jgi:hypothetical protein